jgi:DNA-binding NarL/FixJ family response regulator
MGYHVAIIADHGDHFIKASKQCPVDLVVVNVGPYRKPMLGMNGLATAGFIREHTPLVPVLALSDQPDEAIAYRAFRAGALGFEHSEVDEPVLARMMATLLRGDYFSNHYMRAYMAGVRKPEPKLVLSGMECLASLTKTEVQLFQVVLQEPRSTLASIAARRDRSYNTVKTHMQHIHQKLKLRSRAALIHFGAHHGIVVGGAVQAGQ